MCGVVAVGVCSWAEWGSESEAPGDVAKFNLPQRSFSTLYWSSLYAVFSAFRNMAQTQFLQVIGIHLLAVGKGKSEKVVAVLHVCGLVSTTLVF